MQFEVTEDARAGVINNAELRERLKEIYEAAENTPVERPAARQLRLITQAMAGETDEFEAFGRAASRMLERCNELLLAVESES